MLHFQMELQIITISHRSCISFLFFFEKKSNTKLLVLLKSAQMCNTSHN